jgi:hypothetical protein
VALRRMLYICTEDSGFQSLLRVLYLWRSLLLSPHLPHSPSPSPAPFHSPAPRSVWGLVHWYLALLRNRHLGAIYYSGNVF